MEVIVPGHTPKSKREAEKNIKTKGKKALTITKRKVRSKSKGRRK